MIAGDIYWEGGRKRHSMHERWCCRRSLLLNALLCWRVAWRSAGSIACPLNMRNERNMHNPRIVHNTRKMHNMHNMRNMRIMHNTLFCFRRRIK